MPGKPQPEQIKHRSRPLLTFPVLVQLGLHPLFRRMRALRDHKVVNRGRELAEDLQTRWEMSDSPLVQRMQVLHLQSAIDGPAAFRANAVRRLETGILLSLSLVPSPWWRVSGMAT